MAGPDLEKSTSKVAAITKPSPGLKDLDPLSLYMIPRTNLIRITAWKVVQSLVFWAVINSLVVLYSLCLVLRYQN